MNTHICSAVIHRLEHSTSCVSTTVLSPQASGLVSLMKTDCSEFAHMQPCSLTKLFRNFCSDCTGAVFFFISVFRLCTTPHSSFSFFFFFSFHSLATQQCLVSLQGFSWKIGLTSQTVSLFKRLTLTLSFTINLSYVLLIFTICQLKVLICIKSTL